MPRRPPRERARVAAVPPASAPVRLFAFAIFLSATLLFLVQPLTGKILLPVLGGSPSVWSTCLVFFQTALLAGYVYAHILTTAVPRRWRVPIHVGVLLAAGVMLPLPIDVGAPGVSDPAWWTLRVLTTTAGLPFFVLSATTPLLQQWFSRTGAPESRDPYFLYAASNAGSLVGLLAYPLIEPLATRSGQATGWTVGFWVAAVAIVLCAMTTGPMQAPAPESRLSATGPKPGRPLTWMTLALVPSALLLGVTAHLATDIVSAPMLWVVPLAVYLVTFIVAFSSRGAGRARRWSGLAPWAALVVVALGLAEVRHPIGLVTLAHLLAFVVLAMACHVRLAETRPDVSSLTGYYVCVSLGGALGGMAVALAAPAVFSSILEYPLAIAAVLLVRPQTADADRAARSPAARWAWRAGAAVLLAAAYWSTTMLAGRAGTTDASLIAWLEPLAADGESAQRLLRALLVVPAAVLALVPRAAVLFAGVVAGLLAGSSVVTTGGDVLHRERTFFGVHQVTAIQGGDWHVMTHGTTTHGVQATRGRMRMLPTAYYHPSGPLGDVVFTLSADRRFGTVGAIGLGAGALAAYGGGSTRMDFFEIDEAVIRIAEDPRYFTYLTDARARGAAPIRTMAVDGRLGLAAATPGSYDVIVADAFSSDVIPTHLLTTEAMAIYVSRLTPRGVLAFHISNRLFDFTPVLARLAIEHGLVAYVRDDRDVPAERAAEAMRPSVWVVLGRDRGDLGQITTSPDRWRELADTGARLWTDDYTNVFATLGGR